MRFFRRIAGLLGFVKEDGGDHQVRDQQELDEGGEDDQNHQQEVRFRPNIQETGLPRKGFSVPVQVAVDRPQHGPIVAPCTSGDGGVQGLKWYAKRLRIDEDGDVADEFLDEVLPDTSLSVCDQQKPLPRFQVKYNTRPAKIRNQVVSHDGKIQHGVEFQGRLQWV